MTSEALLPLNSQYWTKSLSFHDSGLSGELNFDWLDWKPLGLNYTTAHLSKNWKKSNLSILPIFWGRVTLSTQEFCQWFFTSWMKFSNFVNGTFAPSNPYSTFVNLPNSWIGKLSTMLSSLKLYKNIVNDLSQL